MAYPIEKATKASQIIAEPFCGSGTTLIAIEHADQACRAVIKYHEQPSEDAVRLADKVRQILAEEAGDLMC